jgi:16S rRNA (adenine1518-N6/adenine1519-N6)-dimethyltransferase
VSIPRQVTLARLAELGLRPDKELGQHFLVDDNLLGVIDRLAALRPDDVALEIGAGVGTLTAHLAERCAHVHAVEIDRRLELALTRTLEGRDNVTLYWGDAMRIALASFEPPASAFVANLPYHVAAPLVLDSIGGLPAVQRWCVLVQREIAERLTAAPSSPLYGGPSVLCALALEQTGRHAVSRSVFVPVPNVDSSLIAFARRAEWGQLAADWPAIVATVRAAFGHRRKTVANALALAGWREDRAAVADALRSAGIDPRARAETLEPAAFAALARTEGRP